MKDKRIEERYRSMSEIDHILHRPGMYVGSTKLESSHRFIYSMDEAKMEQKTVEFVPAILKIFDEIVSNSCDEYRRSTNFGLNEISLKMYTNGKVIVRDNGGIPVVIHEDAGCYVPEFIFGRFRTSSNYDDSEDRSGVGTNGVGSKYANVYSKEFIIETADGKKSFKRTWKDNMSTLCDDLTIKDSKEHYLQTTFILDFEKFETDDRSFDMEFAKLIEKRMIDAAAANPGLKTSFEFINENDITLYQSEWEFNAFTEYIELYSDYVDQSNCISFETEKQSVWVYPDGNLSIGFVNGAECSDPKGTHIRSIRSDINQEISKFLHSKHNIDVKDSGINDKYSVFCSVTVSNPSYDSQTKEKLTTPPEKFDKNLGKKLPVPSEFFASILKSEIIETILDWYKQKTAAENKREMRRMNKQLKNKIRTEKFIDANSRNRRECELWLFEGDSAKSGFRVSRNPQTQGAYILKGVIKNTMGMTPQQVMKHKELADVMSVLGIQWGEPIKVDKLNFGKIVIATDADHDGDKIAGLLLVFFNLFPELFEAGMVMRSLSPIITATRGSEIREYFTYKEYKQDEPNLQGYHIKWNKGLGGLSKNEYDKMMKSPKFHVYVKDEFADSGLRSWFGKGIASVRKALLSEEV